MIFYGKMGKSNLFFPLNIKKLIDVKKKCLDCTTATWKLENFWPQTVESTLIKDFKIVSK